MSCSDVEYDAMKSDGEFEGMDWSEDEYIYTGSQWILRDHVVSQAKHKRTAVRRKSTEQQPWSRTLKSAASSMSVSYGSDSDDDEEEVGRSLFNVKATESKSESHRNNSNHFNVTVIESKSESHRTTNNPFNVTAAESKSESHRTTSNHFNVIAAESKSESHRNTSNPFNVKAAESKSESHRNTSNPLLQPIAAVATSQEQPSSERTNHESDAEMSSHMDPEIYKTVRAGCVVAFRRLLLSNKIQEQLFWNQVSPQGNTILHLAAASGNLELVTMIIQHTKHLNAATNSMGDLPLHVAASAGHLPVVKALLITIHSAYGRSRYDHPHTLKQNKEGDTGLHLALRKRHQGVAEFLVQQHPQASYFLNKDETSPLYMAAEACYLQIVILMMDDKNSAGSDHRNSNGQLKGKSVVHAALRSKDKEILNTIIMKEPALLDSIDEQGMTPMFFAASAGYFDGVCKLIDHSKEQAYQRHQSGLFPIHIASFKGHVNIVEMFLERCPDSVELLVSPMADNPKKGKKNKELLKQSGQNILHMAAKGGRANVVSYLLKKREVESLINQKDLHGNTPLHLAATHWHPKIVSILTWDSRVNLKLKNNHGFTALDIAERVPTLSTYRQRLTWVALLSSGAPRANMQSSIPKIPSNADKYNNRINTLLLMATLVATVTFAAGFTMPGGYANDADQQQKQGMANLDRNHIFQVFVTCDIIALYS